MYYLKISANLTWFKKKQPQNTNFRPKVMMHASNQCTHIKVTYTRVLPE